MEIKRRDFIKLTGLMGIGTIVPFNKEEGNPYNLWKPLAPSRLEKAETVCPLCDSFCKLEILKKRENIFSVFSKDKKGLCSKIFTYHNIIYNEGRIKTPVIRKGERGKVSFNPVDYDRAIEILKENYKKDKFYTLAYTKGEADKYFLNALSKRINFYPESFTKALLGVDKVYFDIENADLILNFGSDIVNSGNYLDKANFLSHSAKKIFSFTPMVTKGTALGERWVPVRINDIPYLTSLIVSALNKTSSFNLDELEKRLGFNRADFNELIALIKNSKKISVTFGNYLAETEEGLQALFSVIDLANVLKSVNKEGGTFFYNYPVGSKPYNIFKEDVKNLLLYDIDPLLTDYSSDLRDRLKNIPFIVYIGSHHSEISKYADLILPLSFFVEKDELYIKRDKKGFSAIISSPAIEGGVEAVELRKKENIELIFQKILNYKAPYGIKDISEIAKELENNLPNRKTLLASLAKNFKISMLSPQIKKGNLAEQSDETSVYLYEDGLIDFSNRGSKWAEEVSNLNRALINRKLAEKHKIQNGDIVEIKTETGQIRVKCLIYEGIADNTIGLKRYKVPADINHYSNKNIGFKSKDKEIESIWWKNEDIPLNNIFKAKGELIPQYSGKIVSIKKI
ncbi:MAG: hypothetical protein N2999_04790 [Proteobacteria bacterium]|nr:hypothetical protein [Pseudomonadota bacterium]